MFVTAAKGSPFYEKYKSDHSKQNTLNSSAFQGYIENADENDIKNQKAEEASENISGAGSGMTVLREEEENQEVRRKSIFDRLEDEAAGNTAPYMELADENGVIEYNGAAFVCDKESNAITLGDCSAGADVLTISLPDSGGVLKVNRSNIGQLMDAITMFSPRDRWAIIRAVSTDSYCERVKKQVEEESDSEFTNVETSGYSVTQDPKSGNIRIGDKKAQNAVSFRSVEDIVIQKDAATGTKMLINDLGNGFYCAVQVTDELEAVLKKALGTEELPETGMRRFQIHTDPKTGIQYMTANGYESRGGSLIMDDEDRKKLMELANTYLADYPGLISNLDEAIAYAAFEVTGIAKRTKNGFMMLGPNSLSFHEMNNNSWSILFDEADYEEIKKHWDEVWEKGGMGNIMEQQDFWTEKINGRGREASEEEVTNQRIVVKADGSRVLMMTIQVGDIQTSMSIELTPKTSSLKKESSADFEFDFQKEQAAEKYERHLA